MSELQRLIKQLINYFNSHYVAIPPELWELLEKIESEAKREQ